MATSSLTSTVGTFGLSAVGGYLFGPVGFAAGALLGSFLFGQGGPDIEGPRLGDLNVSSSSYGGVIPRCYAVQKVAGQIIWATDIVEDKNTRKVGEGVFGGGQKVTEYRYYANCAVLFAEGECDGLLAALFGYRDVDCGHAFNWHGYIDFIYLWNRLLDLGARRAIRNNPYQLVKPRLSGRTYVAYGITAPTPPLGDSGKGSIVIAITS